MKQYILLIVDITYGFSMFGSTYLDDEPFMFKKLKRMVKDYARIISSWKIIAFHSMDQEYSIAHAIRSHCHGIENLSK